MLPPAGRTALMVDNARAIFEDEAEFIAAGWPSAHQLGWRSELWLSLAVNATGADKAVATLFFGDPKSKSQFSFEWACRKGEWYLANLGDPKAWSRPALAFGLGQEGALTEVLAVTLVRELDANFGNPRSRHLATGNELERGRIWAAWNYPGSRFRPDPWPGMTERLQLEPQSTEVVVGEWIDGSGRPTGEKVKFRRVSGLWKVEDHTQGGQWLPLPTQRFRFPADLTILGYEIGSTKAQLKPYVSVPEEEWANSTWFVNSRLVALDFTPEGRLWRVEAVSGGTDAGLNVGDPFSHVQALFGPPTSTEADHVTYVRGREQVEIFHKGGFVSMIRQSEKK